MEETQAVSKPLGEISKSLDEASKEHEKSKKSEDAGNKWIIQKDSDLTLA
jgi:hypothetical protein